jgi:type I restriction-modification system DNA methylase subunit
MIDNQKNTIEKYEKFIIGEIIKLQGKYTPYQIFTDWITMMAISIQNSCYLIESKVYQEREKTYRAIAAKYSKEEMQIMIKMFAALTNLLEEKFNDYLGEIYMKSGCGSKMTGQFFTPYHISYLTASLAYGNTITPNEQGVIEVNEPSTGGGGMMIAIAQVMKEHDLDYQRKLHIIAQDMDWNGVYMTYIQLSLLGIRAIVAQGDTLGDPYHRGYDRARIFKTPAEMGALI